jgi:hypothetical protein
MTSLIITDIRKSNSERGFDLITAILLSSEGNDTSGLMSLAKKSCNGLLILENSTAERDLPSIGVRRGDQFLRIWAPSGHGLCAGEEIRFCGDEK